MQKLVKRDKLADSGGTSCIPCAAWLIGKKKGCSWRGFSNWNLITSPLLQPSPAPSCRCHHSLLHRPFPSAFGLATPFSCLADRHPMILSGRSSVLEVTRLTARCSLSCLLVTGAPQSFPAWEGPNMLPEFQAKGFGALKGKPKGCSQNSF